MTTHVGLMGFGRIGRNIFRAINERDDMHVTAISDTADHQNLEYLLQYDTIMGRMPNVTSIKGGCLYSRGRQTRMLDGQHPGDVRWGDLGVDIVIEATGHARSRQLLGRHLEAGAQKVIACTPGEDPLDTTIVMGLNHQELLPEHLLISHSSITTHCASFIVKLLDDAFGIERLVFTSTHAYTNDQSLGDVPASDLRQSRAAGENIIPTQGRALSQLKTLFGHLQDKISGMSIKVPVPNGSLIDMVTFTREPVTRDAVNEVVRTAAAADYRNFINYVEAPIVSSDVERSPYSTTFDSLATMVLGDNLIKTISWFDNGWGYANRVVDLIEHIGAMEASAQ